MYKIKSGLEVQGKLNITDVDSSEDNSKILALVSDGTVNFVTGTIETLHSVTLRGNATGNEITLSGITNKTGTLNIPDNLGGRKIWIGENLSTGSINPVVAFLSDLQDVAISFIIQLLVNW